MSSNSDANSFLIQTLFGEFKASHSSRATVRLWPWADVPRVPWGWRVRNLAWLPGAGGPCGCSAALAGNPLFPRGRKPSLECQHEWKAGPLLKGMKVAAWK